ncbi:hypothetical protein VVR84_14145 [Kocuria carniphila]|uniref:Uncharacterized protein n=1 Tax=Kocuria carniphila TaxID=262208 RepID=A0ABV3V613_9MICC
MSEPSLPPASQQFDELIDLLGLEVEVEIGNDDAVYGNYIQFGPASRHDPELFPAVLDFFGIPLPFDGAVPVSSLAWLPNLQRETLELTLHALGDPSLSITDTGEFLVSFPQLRSDSEETLSLVDYFLPSTLFEHDLPEKHRYWQPDPEDLYQDSDDDLMDLYQAHPVPVDTLIGELKSLRASAVSISDPSIQKALLFASYSLVESFTNQQALTYAGRFTAAPDATAYLLRLLRQELKTVDRRRKLVKAFRPEKEYKEIPHWPLRNDLAHDIGAVPLENGQLTYEDRSKPVTIAATELFDQLINYASNYLR